MKNTKGFTLIELAVVLAIIAVLAAIITPLAINYLEQARISRAMGDAKTIAQAVTLYRKDVGFFPAYASAADAAAPTVDYHLLVGGPLTGGTTATTPTPTATGWSALFAQTAGSLISVLNAQPGGIGLNTTNPGRIAFRGPYIGNVDLDPWGNPYIVVNLDSASSHAFVISAGPNGILDTPVAQPLASGLTATGDDIVIAVN